MVVCGLNNVGVFSICFKVPDQVDSLSAELAANSSVTVRWSQPVQTNGIIVGKSFH